METPNRWTSDAGDRPILILATGQRCGSTWVQRMLSSHPDVFIWGEHDGHLESLFAAADGLAACANTWGHRAAAEFAKTGNRAFIAGILPTEAVLREQVRSLLAGVFRRQPDGTEPPEQFRWGFKEVRYGADFVREFARYFPHARVVHLTRDPIAVLRSLDWWERAPRPTWKRDATVGAMNRWRDINASFLDATDLKDAVLSIRYEDLTAAPDEVFGQLCLFLDLDATALDRDGANEVVHSVGPFGRRKRQLRERSEIVDVFGDLLADPQLRIVADNFGYALDA